MVRKRVGGLPYERKSFFVDEWKCFGIVLKNSDAQYNVENVFHLHTPVVVTGAGAVAESNQEKNGQKEWMTSWNDTWFGDYRANQSLRN